jgi:hypothetical protein
VNRTSTPVAKHKIAASLIFALSTVVLAWPLLRQVDTSLVGLSQDVAMNLWADWWTQKAIGEGLDFYHTDFLFYPQGTSLILHSFSHVTTLISLLLAPVLGRFAAYNLAVLVAQHDSVPA